MKTPHWFSRTRLYSAVRFSTAAVLLSGAAAMAFVAINPSGPFLLGNQIIHITRSTNSDRVAIKVAATGEPWLVRKQIAGHSPQLKKLMRIALTRLATFRSS